MVALYDTLALRKTFAFEALTVAGTAVGFTQATYNTSTNAARAALARVEGAPCRYRTDGTNPTATVGVLLQPGDVILVLGASDLELIRFIRQGASATLNVEYLS